jgi:hypothetical protein
VQVGNTWSYQETHSCAGWCGLGLPEENIEQRRAFRCALPGFDETQWGDGRQAMRLYMGRLPIVGQDVPEDVNPDRPPDDHEDGCPGAWYRSEFANSLARYERILTEHGFSSNLFADRCDDRLVLEALQCIEQERVRARSHWAEARAAKER